MKASKKLIGASVALVAALAVSVGTTYAWFTTNNKVTVENIQASVTTGDSNLEVALINDGTVGSFGYTLDMSGKFSTVKLDALTDAAGTNGATLTDKKDGEAAEGSYIEFFLQFRTPAAAEAEDEIELKLSTSSTVTSAPGENHSDLIAWDNESLTKWSISKGQAIAAEAKDTVRVAFLPVGEDLKSIDEESVEDDGLVWEPNASSGHNDLDDSGKKYAQVVDEHFSGTPDLSAKYADPDYNDIDLGETVIKLTVDGNYYTANICVRVWIEGTDADCLNTIFDDLVTIKLEFEIEEE